MAKWKKCQVDKIPYDLENRDVFVGVDVSAKIDLTSVAFIIPIMDNGIARYIVFSHSFIPNRDKLRERIKKDKQPYDAWEEQDHLTVQDEDIVDQQQVTEYIIAYCELNNWKIKLIAFDPANSSKMMLDMSNMGYTTVEAFQSHKSLNEGTVDLREQVFKGNLLYTYNPLLNYAMANSVIKKNNGLIKIDKDKTTKRIDPVDALICAYKYVMYYEFEPETPELTADYLKNWFNKQKGKENE